MARLLEIDEQHMLGQFETGDAALEIVPIQPVGGSRPGNDLFGVEAWLQRLSDDTRIPAATLETRRWVSSRWPAQHRQRGVSYNVHKILASINDDQQRWDQILDPPLNERTGRKEWTDDAAKRAVGQKVSHPVTAVEKVQAIHDLAVDEQVASTVVSDLLRRPEVAFKAMSDTVARGAVNRAQFEHSRQVVERTMPPAAARSLGEMRQRGEYLELVTACTAFTAAIGRTIPNLAGVDLREAEQNVLRQQVAKVRATADWLETVLDTGNVSMDDGLAALLRGE